MRRIFRLKTRKEDPGRYTNANNEKLASTFEDLAEYIVGGIRWVKRIIYLNDENSSLPAWITQSTFYTKPQIINRVHKRKLPQHLEESLDLINKGLTPTNLALQRMKHEKVIQQRKRVQAIQAALQRRKVLDQQQYDKPKKIIQKFTISYTDDKMKPYEQDFVDRKITLALDLLRQQIDKNDLNHHEERKMIETAVHTNSVNNTLKLNQIDNKVERQQTIKPPDEINIEIVKPAVSPIESLIKNSNKEDILSTDKNPFVGGISRTIPLSQLVNNNKQSSQLFNSGNSIEHKRQESLSSNNNQYFQGQIPTSNAFNRNNAPNNSNNKFQLSSIRQEISLSSYSPPQNHMISNNNYGNRNINIPQYNHSNQQQNIQSNSIPFTNLNSFTNSVNPDLLVNGSARNYFQSSKTQPSLFVHEKSSQGSSKTHKKYNVTQKKSSVNKPK